MRTRTAWRPTARSLRPIVQSAGAAAGVLLLAVSLAACVGTGSPDDEATGVTGASRGAPTKNGADETRTDLDPLVSRFSALGEPVGAVWASGTVGDERAPGPATYWIDAVVTLEPQVSDELAARTAPQETDEIPDVTPALAAELPDGPLLSGPGLDDAFAESGFSARVYLDLDDATIVLVSLGQ